jgi:hypothetical protein
MDRETIGALVFIIFILIPILFMIGWVLKGYNEPTKPKPNYYVEYQKSLRNKDGNATYWGKLYYGYNECFTIHQQNNIQLQIQNDLLSHS